MNEEIRIGKRKTGWLRPVLAVALAVAGGGIGSYVVKVNAGLETLSRAVQRLGELERVVSSLTGLDAVAPLLAPPVVIPLVKVFPAPPQPPQPPKSWQDQMLEAHNDWRRVVDVPPLKWSAELERSAQQVVDQLAAGTCELKHSGGKYGENLHKSGALKWTDGRVEHSPESPAQIVAAWGSEADSYRWADNACSGVCGHYTQVVWKDTKAVGCARARCANNDDVVVCQYDPAGNIRGQRPF